MRRSYLSKSRILKMLKTFFEEKGADLLKRIGMTKTEFARKMGIRRQNVNVLFRTKNLHTIRKAAEVLGVPFEMLIGYTSEPDIASMPVPERDGQPLASGYFGPIYDSFRGRPKEAFWFLIDHQDGDLIGVYSIPGIGDIDLVWGDAACGVNHILLKHINDKDFPTVNQMIDAVSEIVISGNLSFESEDKLVIRKNGFVVIIRKNYWIDGKKLESKNWILTAYSKESSGITLAPLDTN